MADRPTLEDQYEDLRRRALYELETLARRGLRKSFGLSEFIMGNGTAALIDDQGNTLHLSDRAFGRVIRDFLDRWDSVFHLTGTPMRFTADGPTRTDW